MPPSRCSAARDDGRGRLPTTTPSDHRCPMEKTERERGGITVRGAPSFGVPCERPNPGRDEEEDEEEEEEGGGGGPVGWLVWGAGEYTCLRSGTETKKEAPSIGTGMSVRRVLVNERDSAFRFQLATSTASVLTEMPGSAPILPTIQSNEASIPSDPEGCCVASAPPGRYKITKSQCVLRHDTISNRTFTQKNTGKAGNGEGNKNNPCWYQALYRPRA